MKLLLRLKNLLLTGLLLLLAAELFLSLYGLPSSMRQLLCERLDLAGLPLRIGWVKVSLLRGITLEELAVTFPTPHGRLLVTADSAELKLKALPLWRRQFVVHRLRLRDAELHLVDSHGALLSSLTAMDVRAEGDASEELKLTLRTRFNAANLSLSLDVAHAPQLVDMLLDLAENKGRPDSLWRQPLGRQIKAVSDFMERLDFADKEANLHLAARLDAADPERSEVQGNFDWDYGKIGNLVIQRIGGRVQLADGVLRLRDLKAIFGNNERLQADLRLNLLQRTLSAAVSGQMLPQTLAELFPGSGLAVPKFVSVTQPIVFQGGVEETAWDVATARPQLQIWVRDFSVFGHPWREATAQAVLAYPLLHLQDIQVAADYLQKQRISGDLRCNLAERTLAGTLRLQLNPLEAARKIGLALPESVPLRDFNATEFTLEISESPADWRRLRATLRARESDFMVDKFNVSSLLLLMRLDQGVVNIDQLAVGLKETPAEAVVAQASFSLETLLKRQLLEIPFSLEVRIPGAEGGGWEEGLAMSGTAVYDLRAQRLSVPEAEGRVRFDRVYACYNTLLELPPVGIVQKIRLRGEPGSFRLQVPPFKLENRPDWKLLFDLEAQNASYDTLEIHHATGRCEIDRKATRFIGLDGIADEGCLLSLDLTIFHSPLSLLIEKARVVGKPEIISVFIDNQPGKEIYAAIWDKVGWDKEHPTVTELSRLTYYEDPFGANWQLQLEATLKASRASYNGLPIAAAEAHVSLNLPYGMRIDPIIISDGRGELTGKAELLFSGTTSCTFAVEEATTAVDYLGLLKAIHPDWSPYLDRVVLDPHAKIACSGNIFFAAPLSYTLQGSLETPHMVVNGQEFHDLQATWSYDSARFGWDVTRSRYRQGNLRSTGFYDHQSRFGETILNLSQIPLHQFSPFRQGNGGSKPDDMRGLLQTECKLKFMPGWAGLPYYLEGSGHLALRQADLWSGQLFGNLGKLIAMGTLNLFSRDNASALGTISELDADYEFSGSRLIVPTFSTNGTIIALSGSGEYSLLHDRLHFVVSGEALKNVNVVAFMLKPLSWAFDAELVGPAKQPQWRLRTALRKIFSTE